MAQRKRRSFPIKISTDFADRGTQEAVVLDLVHKFPRGPQGTQTKEDYYQWSTDPHLEQRKDGETCGYKNLDLYRLVIQLAEVTDNRPTGEWDYRQLVRSMFPDVGPRGVTRRSRRLANRLGAACRRIFGSGLPGIWQVTWGYSEHEKVFMHANTEEDAKIQAKMFFGQLMGTNEYRLAANFDREGSPLELLNANDPCLKGFDALITNQRERIAKMKKTIEEFEMNKSFLEMYAINCISANDDMEEEAV
jgi:hypothetical protein